MNVQHQQTHTQQPCHSLIDEYKGALQVALEQVALYHLDGSLGQQECHADCLPFHSL